MPRRPRGFPPDPTTNVASPPKPAPPSRPEPPKFGAIPTVAAVAVANPKTVIEVVGEALRPGGLAGVENALSVMPRALIELDRGEIPDGVPRSPPEFPEGAARAGGIASQASRKRLALITGLGVSKNSPLFTDDRVQPYARQALEYASAITKQYAAEFGGGVCSPTASLEIISACRAMLWAAWAADRFDVEESMKAGQVMSKHFDNAKRICLEEAEHRRKNSNESAADSLAKSFEENVRSDDVEEDEDADIEDV